MRSLYKAATLAALIFITSTITPTICNAKVTCKSKIKVPTIDVTKDLAQKDVRHTYTHQKEYRKKVAAIRKALLHLNPHIPTITSYKISFAICKYSKIYSIDPLLIASVIAIETGKTFIPTLNRGFGWGLMQIVPRWHKKRFTKLGIRRKIELYHVFKNIKVGCDILKECLKLSKGNKERALIYYNGSNLKHSYSKAVMSCYYRLKSK